jgi:hypothetical protein
VYLPQTASTPRFYYGKYVFLEKKSGLFLNIVLDHNQTSNSQLSAPLCPEFGQFEPAKWGFAVAAIHNSDFSCQLCAKKTKL